MVSRPHGIASTWFGANDAFDAASRGAVDYYSIQGAQEAIGCVFPPMLQLVDFNTCGGGESSEGSSESAYHPPMTSAASYQG